VSRIAVGSRVRVLDRPELEAWLGSPDASERPEPAQFAEAGRRKRVVGVRLDAGEPLYLLADAPGVWREDWLRPA
jgi:hypothetical protein